MRQSRNHRILIPLLAAIIVALLLAGTDLRDALLAQAAMPEQEQPPAAAAMTSESSAVWRVDPSDLTVGDLAHLTLTVTHPANVQALLPTLDAQWGDFEVRSQSPVAVTENVDGSLTTRQIFEATLFAPGDYATPPLTVTLSDAAGNLREIPVEPAMVTVASVLTDGETELRDIKAQALLPPARNILPLVGGLIVLAGLAGAVRGLYRRSRQAVDTRTPLERAMDDLEDIVQADYLATDQVARYYVEATDVLRRYLEETHGLPAPELTTAELSQRLEQSQIDPIYMGEIVALLNDADLVKFANLTVKDEAAARLIADLRTLIHGLAAHAAAPAPAYVEHAKLAEGNSQPAMYGA